MFDRQPQSNISKPPHPAFPQRPLRGSDSESSGESNSDSDDDCNNSSNKKQKMRGKDPPQHQDFMNPNFVKSGGMMPPLPKSRNIWGNIMEEQILTATVGSFNMQKKVVSDRDVESYDYTRAKDDDRPSLPDDEMDSGEEREELFGEVIDLEKTAFKQRRTLKRKHVSERLGQRKSVKDRLELPKVTDSSSVEDVTHYISTMLEEPKIHLISQSLLYCCQQSIAHAL
jgi:hypothetical protein